MPGKQSQFISRWPKRGPSRSCADAELIAMCLAGDERAWDHLVERYAPLINTVTIRMGLCREDGADILQDVSILLIDHLANLRNQERLAAWIITTTRREAWRLLRKRTPTPVSSVDERQAAQASPLFAEEVLLPEEVILALAEHERVRQCVQRLPDLCRRLLKLLYFESPSVAYGDAAKELNISSNSIGPNRTRCLSRLRKLLEDENT